MNKSTYNKIDIACEYIDLAMQCYVEGHNYFCAIHLAGAAEELFGAHLAKDKRISTVAWKARGLGAAAPALCNANNPFSTARTTQLHRRL